MAEYEFEQVWDVFGFLLAAAGVISFILIFAGANPTFNEFSTEVVTGHLIAVGLGIALVEGGARKLVENLFNALQ